MKNIKLSFAGILAAALIIAGCGKENDAPPQYASVMFVNAAPVSIAKPTASLYLNDSVYSNGFVGYNTNTGYIGVLAGSRTFTLRQDNGTYSASAPIIATDGPANYNVNEAYTLFSFDSLSTSNAVKFLKLNDTLAIPDINQAKVRFLQLAPGYPSTATPNVDVTYLRTSVTPNDSVTILNRNFPATNAVAQNSFFTKIPDGTYTIKIKLQGTQTLAATVSAVAIQKRRILTHYLTGNGAGRALSFNTITHF